MTVSRNSLTPILPGEVGLKKFTFRDVSPRFLFHPLTGDLTTLTDLNAVANAIKLIVLTEKRERHFSQIDFGVGIENYMFDLITPELAEELIAEITEQISIHEPRALIFDVRVEPYQTDNAISVFVKFGMKTSNQTQDIHLILERN